MQNKLLNPQNCYEIGVNTAKLHMITKSLTGNRENKLSIKSWRKIFENVKKEWDGLYENDRGNATEFVMHGSNLSGIVNIIRQDKTRNKEKFFLL